MGAPELFFIFLITGLMLIGAEVFVPGGVVGFIGGMSLLGAVVTGFIAFPGYGGFIAAGIVLLVGVVVGLWIKYFPRSPVGKKMTVTQDLATFRAGQDDLAQLRGKEGEALSELRPAGFAMIDGRRIDVVTQGEMILKGAKVSVVDVDGNRVVVAKKSN
jgi:membrane-bound serine protease (ClpP class)